MRLNPGIKVNWEAGSADFDIGSRLAAEHPLLQVDVIGDIKADVDQAYAQSFERMYPGLTDERRRQRNLQRRVGAEGLVGQIIRAVKVLSNGDIALELATSKVLVVSASGGVGVEAVSSIGFAEEVAAEHAQGTQHTDEPFTPRVIPPATATAQAGS